MMLTLDKPTTLTILPKYNFGKYISYFDLYFIFNFKTIVLNNIKVDFFEKSKINLEIRKKLLIKNKSKQRILYRIHSSDFRSFE